MKYCCFTFLWLASFFSNGQVVDSLAFVNLNDALLRFQTSELMRHGTLGVSLCVTGSGQQLLGVNAEKSLPPASTLKLVTTATALEVLGDNFTFETYLEYDGSISGGILKGNLYIRGTGDPSLGSTRFKDRTDSATVFNNWLGALRTAGIQQIHGKVIADASYFDDLGIEDSWLWGDIANGYGAATSGLNWGENMCRLYFKPAARVGEPARLLRVEPSLTNVQYVNLVTTGPVGSGDKTLIRPSATLTNLIVDGTVPKVKRDYSIRGAVFNPALLLAEQFTQFLRSQNLSVKGKAENWTVEKNSQERKPLTTHSSPPLSELSAQTNWWSLNLYADAIIKAVGKKMIGKTDFKSVAPAVVSFWALKGINVSGIRLRDGSGLAGSALLTPQNLSDILNAAAKFKSFPAFFGTIAIAGDAGTVRSKRFGNKSNIRAKSGSIEGTRAYAGYVSAASGQRLSFVVNANRYLPDSAAEVSKQLVEIVRLIGEL